MNFVVAVVIPSDLLSFFFWRPFFSGEEALSSVFLSLLSFPFFGFRSIIDETDSFYFRIFRSSWLLYKYTCNQEQPK